MIRKYYRELHGMENSSFIFPLLFGVIPGCFALEAILKPLLLFLLIYFRFVCFHVVSMTCASLHLISGGEKADL